MQQYYSRLFKGADFDIFLDYKRLKSQIDRVFGLMRDGHWRTLQEIKTALENRYPGSCFPESSLSAQLRNLRKDAGGRHVVNRDRKKGRGGTYKYQLIERNTLFN